MKISLIVWRDAAKDPPGDELENLRVAALDRVHSARVGRPTIVFPYGNVVRSHPDVYEVWGLPIPPAEDGLTVKDVRRVCDLAWGSAIGRPDLVIVKRLRAALPEGGESA